MADLIQAMTGGFQAFVAGVQVVVPLVAQTRLPLECLRSLGGVEFRGMSPESLKLWLASTDRIFRSDGL